MATRRKNKEDQKLSPEVLANLVNGWDRRDVTVLLEHILKLAPFVKEEYLKKYLQALPLVTGADGIPNVLAVDRSGQALVITPRGLSIKSLDSIVMKYI